MQLKIKKGGGLPYARKEAYEYNNEKFEADLITGGIVKILDSGETEVGNYGEQTVFKIKTRNGDKKIPFNQKTINVLVQEFGEETENWINKEVKTILHKGIFGGKKSIACYLVTNEWQIDEYGELFKAKGNNMPLLPENAPQVPFQGNDEAFNKEITIDQIPF